MELLSFYILKTLLRYIICFVCKLHKWELEIKRQCLKNKCFTKNLSFPDYMQQGLCVHLRTGREAFIEHNYGSLGDFWFCGVLLHQRQPSYCNIVTL